VKKKKKSMKLPDSFQLIDEEESASSPWRLWEQLDLEDELERTQLAVFFHTLFETQEMSCDPSSELLANPELVLPDGYNGGNSPYILWPSSREMD